MDKKTLVGEEIARRVENGQTIGVGTGSTVDAALTAIGRRAAAQHLEVSVVATSLETAWRCEALGLTVRAPGYGGPISWGFDGADAVDERLRAVKGRGGALLREKILAVRCRPYILIVDDSKLCPNIAAKCPVPVEVVPEALPFVKERLAALGAGDIQLRLGVHKHGPVITEYGHVILDVSFAEIADDLEERIKAIVGVVESGLFLRYATEVLAAGDNGVRSLRASRLVSPP